MDKVWMLWHTHAWEDGHQDTKLIGDFGSEHDARSAREVVQNQPGFRELPEGFCISEEVIGRLSWTDGYVTLQPGEEFE